MSGAKSTSLDPKATLYTRGPFGSILIAGHLTNERKSTQIYKQRTRRFYYFATLLVFLFLYSWVAAEAFIVIGLWQKTSTRSNGVCLQMGSKVHVYSADCSLIRPARPT